MELEERIYHQSSNALLQRNPITKSTKEPWTGSKSYKLRKREQFNTKNTILQKNWKIRSIAWEE